MGDVAVLLGALTSSLQPGQTIYDAARKTIVSIVYPQLGEAYLVQIWILFGMHNLIVVFSLVGIYLKWERRELWFFQRDETGNIRPNTSVISQISFALHSLLLIAVTPLDFIPQAFPDPDAPPAPTSQANYTVYAISFIPLFIAIYFLILSTIMAPTTSLRFLHAPLSTQKKTHASATDILLGRQRGERRFILSTAGLGLILGTLVPWIGISAFWRAKLYSMTNTIYHHLIDLESQDVTNGTSPLGLLVLMPQFTEFLAISNKVLRYFRILSGTGIGWCLLTWIAYCIAAARLFKNIQTSRRRVARSLRSLKALNDLVTQNPVANASPDTAAPLFTHSPRARSESNTGMSTHVVDKNASIVSLDDKDSVQNKTPRTDMLEVALEMQEIQTTLPKSPIKQKPSLKFATNLIKSSNLMRPSGRPDSGMHTSSNSEGQLSRGKESARGSRAGIQMEELKKKHAKTEKIYVAVIFQFIVTTIMCLWSCGIMIWLLIVPLDVVNSQFIIHTGWSFTVPTFVASCAFLWFLITAKLKDNQKVCFYSRLTLCFRQAPRTVNTLGDVECRSCFGSLKLTTRITGLFHSPPQSEALPVSEILSLRSPPPPSASHTQKGSQRRRDDSDSDIAFEEPRAAATRSRWIQSAWIGPSSGAV